MLAVVLLLGLQVHPDGELTRITNPGPWPLVGLRYGDDRRERLEPGATWTLERTSPAVAGARFPIDTWADALGDLTPTWAEVHLRTAGFFLDAAEPGPEGEPTRAANVLALSEASADLTASWAEGPPLRLALAARAARHTKPGPLLRRLLERVPPDAPSEPWPEPYTPLEALPELVRAAIEAGGPAALKILSGDPRWASDRGFSDGRLALAWEPPTLEPAPFDDAPLARALDAGDRALALQLGLDGALVGSKSRLVCGALDLGAQQAAYAGQALAAEGWLRLAARACPAEAAFRSRAAAALRLRGESRYRSGDLAGAAGHFRAALWLAGLDADRARLADTLADLSLLRFARGQAEAGRAFLDAAREVDPVRPKVLQAADANPGLDPRARAGLVVVFALLGMFALRRLRRLWQRKTPSPAALRRKWRA